MIDMKMAEQKYVHLGHLRAALAKSERAASSSIKEDASLAVLPYQIDARLSCSSGPPDPSTCNTKPVVPQL